ncbi:transposase [Nitrosophilus labii]|uniref:transposase n=1 Tax=Nitrosophilus labii TaxID=2706014 RepID=UPI0016575644|nr:transposase [Nitrosophilus labii]
MVTSTAKREAVKMMMSHKISQQRACKEIGISRSQFVYEPKQPKKDKPLRDLLKSISEIYPRFGYGRIAVMLSWRLKETINIKRVYRIWYMLNLQLPKKRPKRKRLETNPIKMCSQHTNHVWSSDRAANGQKLKSITNSVIGPTFWSRSMEKMNLQKESH